MKTRVAVIGIIVEDPNSVSALNDLLHEYAPYIIGRMGIPYRAHHLNVISVAVDATDDTISALAGRLGALPGISAKTAYSNAYTDEEE
ncbi:MAG: iron-only hydrogenase system regulator [Coriobacteriaceae bacterium]|nr:MAG: iron-only hydrogenase system regulator [Coriobacteriaceae bacterium]